MAAGFQYISGGSRPDLVISCWFVERAHHSQPRHDGAAKPRL